MRAVDSHKVADLRSLAKERLPPIFKLLRSLFSFAGKENFRRGIQVNHQAWSGVEPCLNPAVQTLLESPDIAGDPIKRKVEKKMPIVQNDVPQRLVAPRQQLSIPFLGQEIGEPARKAMIVDLSKSELRARTVGLYYLLRSLTITPAAAVGALLWKRSPQTPFVVAGMFGIVGTFVFITMVREKFATN